MQVLESSVRNVVIKFARDTGILVTKMNIMGRRGMPDDVFWLRGGKPLIIEFKAPGETPRKLQRITINYLKELGYDVEECADAEVGIRHIKTRMEASGLYAKVRNLVTAKKRSGTVPRPRIRKD